MTQFMTGKLTLTHEHADIALSMLAEQEIVDVDTFADLIAYLFCGSTQTSTTQAAQRHTWGEEAGDRVEEDIAKLGSVAALIQGYITLVDHNGAAVRYVFRLGRPAQVVRGQLVFPAL